jgi:predicted XRE-type DNA-binding protein
MSDDLIVTQGNNNIFADLGFDIPEEELLKAKLVREIRAIIKRRRLTQVKAADLMGLRQPDVSAITLGNTARFTLDRLVRCLDKLDYRVDVIVKHKPKSERQAAA